MIGHYKIFIHGSGLFTLAYFLPSSCTNYITVCPRSGNNTNGVTFQGFLFHKTFHSWLFLSPWRHYLPMYVLRRNRSYLRIWVEFAEWKINVIYQHAFQIFIKIVVPHIAMAVNTKSLYQMKGENYIKTQNS